MENTGIQRKGLSGSTLKIIAIVTMLIDHIGATVVENMTYLATNEQTYKTLFDIMLTMRIIGRLAFPIFCFLLVEGFFHTKNFKKYILRLFIFALISEVPFDYAFNNSIIEFGSQNVFFTLLIGVIMMWALEYIKNYYTNDKSSQLGLSIIAFIIASFTAEIIACDYSSLGIIVILLMYIFKNDKLKKILSVSLSFALLSITGFNIQSLAGLAFLPICFYNGKKGLSLKYFFYTFYPIHLLILGFIVRYAL